MNDQTPSERVRAILDERGIEHSDTEHMTEWVDANGVRWNFFTSDDGKTDLTMETPWEGITPEQAIAATLGKPTWRNSYDKERYNRWRNSLFYGEPTNFKELIEDVIWTTETVDLGPNGNEYQGIDEGEVNTEGLIESWAKKAAALGNRPTKSGRGYYTDRDDEGTHIMCDSCGEYIGTAEDIAAKLGNGKLTAEIVEPIVDRNCEWYEGGEIDAQAIADELNAVLGGGR